MINLQAAGLNETESKCYQALLERSSWKPADLAEFVGESRTNCYKVLDTLVDLGLARRFDKAKKLHYQAANPARLYELARERKVAYESSLEQMEAGTQALTARYVRTNEQPGVRFFQGREAIKEVFADMLHAGEDIYLMRSPADVEFYDEAFFDTFRLQRANRGIKTYAITPLTKHAQQNIPDDSVMNIIRTIIPVSSYDAAVEWNAYGDKLALISYGDEALAMVIESPAIADSFRQLYALMASTRASLPANKPLTSD